MANDESILDLTKRALGVDPSYDVFDPQLIMHINSVFFTLNQLGIGPESIFQIEDAEVKWSAFMADDHVTSVKSYMYFRVRLMFDPPTSGFALDSMQKQAEEMEWRLCSYMEGVRNARAIAISNAASGH